MADKYMNTTIEILGRPYPVRCLETELASLQEAAALLDKKMSEVQESGKAINLERIAIMTALNLAHQCLQLDQQKSNWMDKINQRIVQLQDKLDTTLNKKQQSELIYTVVE